MNGLLNSGGGIFLAHLSHHDNTDGMTIIEGEIRDAYGRVAFTHKIQEKSVEILTERQARIKIVQIMLLSISTAGVITVIFGRGEIGSILAAVCSACLLGLNMYSKEYSLIELSQRHKDAANRILLIRDKYRTLLTDLKIGNMALNVVQEARNVLLAEAHAVYSTMPNSTAQAYKRAQKALHEDEELTFTDDEIDLLLPSDLRRKQ